MNDDADLRAHFASLRRAAEAKTPGFERVVGRTPRQPNPVFRGLAVAASVVLVAIAAAMLWSSNPHRSPTRNAAAPMLADWRAPTDFLLDTPGRELLYAIPDMGRYPSALGPSPPTRTTTPAPRAGREHS
jgi:hypothetical protein